MFFFGAEPVFLAGDTDILVSSFLAGAADLRGLFSSGFFDFDLAVGSAFLGSTLAGFAGFLAWVFGARAGFAGAILVTDLVSAGFATDLERDFG